MLICVHILVKDEQTRNFKDDFEMGRQSSLLDRMSNAPNVLSEYNSKWLNLVRDVRQTLL